MTEAKPRVVVVGGGFAGAAVAHALDRAKAVDVTLVDTKDYLENTVGVLRAIVDPAATPPQTLHFLHAGYLTRSDVVLGEATEATPRHVVVSLPSSSSAAAASSRFLMLPYDVLVVCTGRAYSLAASQPRGCAQARSLLRARALIEESAAVARSRHVVVVGGRSAGVELAAAVAARHGATKRVTLVEAGPSLLAAGSGLPQDAGAYAWRALEAAGVSVLTGERVVSVAAGGAVATDRGTKLVADAVFNCTGARPNTAWLRAHFGDALDEHGRVRVLPTLQLENHPNVFAAGDVVALAEEKLAATALAHAAVVAKNVLALAALTSAGGAGQLLAAAAVEAHAAASLLAPSASAASAFASALKLKVYHHAPTPMYIGLGTDDAIAVDGANPTGNAAGFGPKVAAIKRKADAAMLKFLPKPVQADLDSQSPQALQPLAAPTPLRSSSSSGSSLMSPDLPQELSPSSGAQHVVLLRFVVSPLAKHIARAALARNMQIHAVVGLTEVNEATELLSYADIRIPITADSPERPAIASVLASARCVILPLWPASYDDESASGLAAECTALAEAIRVSKVRHMVVICPSCRGCVGKLDGPPGSSCDDASCVPCVLARCIETLRKAMPKLTLVFHEPEFRSPFILQTLQSVQLHRAAALPLGTTEAPLAVALIDTADLVEAILQIIERVETHEGEECRITGLDALTGQDIAYIIRRATGEDIAYNELSIQQACEQMVAEGASPAAARILALSGRPKQTCTSADVLALLPPGTKPQSFSQWALAKRAMFLAGRDNEELDLDELLKKPSQIGQLLSSAARGQKALHTELDMSEIVLGERIGAGASAVVYKATFRGAQVAVKQFKPSVIEFEPEVFRQEVAIISILRHPNLVSCIGACTKTPETPWVVFEYMPRGSLDKLFRTFQPAGPFHFNLQVRFVTDIARALRFLHGAGLVHGDLKPANLLVTESLQIKLTDFDTCRVVSPKMRGALGTPDYIAPESFAKKDYTEKVDVYAFGITIWQVATREQPYPALTAMDIPDAVIKGARPNPLPNHVLYPLMCQCWHEKPSRRPTFSKICDEIDVRVAAALVKLEEEKKKLQRHQSVATYAQLGSPTTLTGSGPVPHSEVQPPPPGLSLSTTAPSKLSIPPPAGPPPPMQQQQRAAAQFDDIPPPPPQERSLTPDSGHTANGHRRAMARSVSTAVDIPPPPMPLGQAAARIGLSAMAAALDVTHPRLPHKRASTMARLDIPPPPLPADDIPPPPIDAFRRPVAQSKHGNSLQSLHSLLPRKTSDGSIVPQGAEERGMLRSLSDDAFPSSISPPGGASVSSVSGSDSGTTSPGTAGSATPPLQPPSHPHPAVPPLVAKRRSAGLPAPLGLDIPPPPMPPDMPSPGKTSSLFIMPPRSAAGASSSSSPPAPGLANSDYIPPPPLPPPPPSDDIPPPPLASLVEVHPPVVTPRQNSGITPRRASDDIRRRSGSFPELRSVIDIPPPPLPATTQEKSRHRRVPSASSAVQSSNS